MRAADLRSLLDDGFAGEALSEFAAKLAAADEKDRFPSAILVLQHVCWSLASLWEDAVDVDEAQRLQDTFKPPIRDLLIAVSFGNKASVATAMDRLSRVFLNAG